MANENALAIKQETVDAVQRKIAQYVGSRELVLPPDYSPDNALKSAWLILQNTVTSNESNKQPVLTYCTRESIINSLLDMVVQGLNPQKKQGYFIAYGKQLVFQRSYFGTMAVAKSVDPRIDDIYAEVIYKGDVFKYKIIKGRKEVIEHEQALENINDENILGAYCTIIGQNGEVYRQEIMTFDEIKQAWKQSKMKPVGKDGEISDGSTHDKFTGEMAKRTVTNRACKPIINSSSDSQLFKEIYERTSALIADESSNEEIKANANRLPLDVDVVETNLSLPPLDAEVIAETKTETKPKPEPAQKAAVAKKAPDKTADKPENEVDPSWLEPEK